MSDALILPPHVRGKVLGSLLFFIDEIRIDKKIELFDDESDVVAQVRWWGEKLPVFLRPEKTFINRNGYSKSICSFQQPLYYEIRTTLELLKIYLEDCYVLEIVISKLEDNTAVIGSAFINDLQKFTESVNTVTSPLVDFKGEKIGNLKIHSELKLWSPKSTSKINQNISSIADEFKLPSKILDEWHEIKKSLDKNESEQIKMQMASQGKVQLLLPDKHENKNFVNFTKEKLHKVSNKLLINRIDPINFNSQIGFKENSNLSSICEKPNSSQLKPKRISLKNSNLPQIETRKDTSKVISIGVPKRKNGIRQNELKAKTKSKPSSIRPKNKSALSKSKPLFIKQINISQKPCSLKKMNITLKSNSSRNSVKKVISKSPASAGDVLFGGISPNNTSPAESLDTNKKYPSPATIERDDPTKTMLDYLLGLDMSKEDEEKALSALVEMSPSQHFVERISQSYLTSKRVASEPSTRKHSPAIEHFFKSPISDITHAKSINNLNFDFRHPVERKYYEKFFACHESSRGFQTDEISSERDRNHRSRDIPDWTENQEGNRIEALGGGEKIEESILNWKCHKVDEVGCDDNVDKEVQLINDCCRYYKKLNELDKIITSLNHYKQKILTGEEIGGS